MGALHFLIDLVVDCRKEGKDSTCQIEAYENQNNAFLQIGPEKESHKGYIAEFKNYEQFKKFVDGINDLHDRIKP